MSVHLLAAFLDCLSTLKFLRNQNIEDWHFCVSLLLPLELALSQKCPALGLILYFLVLSPSLKEKENASVLLIEGAGNCCCENDLMKRNIKPSGESEDVQKYPYYLGRNLEGAKNNNK